MYASAIIVSRYIKYWHNNHTTDDHRSQMKHLHNALDTCNEMFELTCWRVDFAAIKLTCWQMTCYSYLRKKIN